MRANELLLDGLERIKGTVHKTVEGLDDKALAFRPADTANSIAWLVWHLTRIQDDHIADLAEQEQVWSDGWYERVDLPFSKDATGYGQSADEVAAVSASSELLLGYYDAVHQASVTYIQILSEKDLAKVVDTHWDPPVTLAVRLVSVLADDLQHAGQAAYVRGLSKNITG
jgi:uncharacterized damage-inducible protein DinB